MEGEDENMNRTSNFDQRSSKNNNDCDQLSLVLRFYGIPSPSQLVTNQYKLANDNRDTYSAPLLLSIPISYQNNKKTMYNNHHEGSMIDWELDLVAPPPALIPTRIWISTDGRIGLAIARLWHHERWIGVSTLIFLLSFPSELIVIFKSKTVPGKKN